MLVITRKSEESLIIGEDIEINILEISNGKVRIGINAPKHIKIVRKEIVEDIKQTNKEAVVKKDSIDINKLNINIFKEKL